jgi:ABC-type spermidine/putrescine transport system permease subunit II
MGAWKPTMYQFKRSETLSALQAAPAVMPSVTAAVAAILSILRANISFLPGFGPVVDFTG